MTAALVKDLLKRVEALEDMQHVPLPNLSGAETRITALEEEGAEVNEINFDGTDGRVLRKSNLVIQDGTVAATLLCQLSAVANGDTDGPTDNVALGATTGNYTLNAGGDELYVTVDAVTGNCVAILSVDVAVNDSGVLVFFDDSVSAGGFAFSVTNGAGAAVDLTGLVDAAKTIILHIAYLTDA